MASWLYYISCPKFYFENGAIRQFRQMSIGDHVLIWECVIINLCARARVSIRAWELVLDFVCIRLIDWLNLWVRLAVCMLFFVCPFVVVYVHFFVTFFTTSKILHLPWSFVKPKKTPKTTEEAIFLSSIGNFRFEKPGGGHFQGWQNEVPQINTSFGDLLIESGFFKRGAKRRHCPNNRSRRSFIEYSRTRSHCYKNGEYHRSSGWWTLRFPADQNMLFIRLTHQKFNFWGLKKAIKKIPLFLWGKYIYFLMKKPRVICSKFSWFLSKKNFVTFFRKKCSCLLEIQSLLLTYICHRR